MGNILSVKLQNAKVPQLYKTMSRIGSSRIKANDDLTCLRNREIEPFETFSVLWLDPAVHRNDQIQTNIKYLQKVVKHIRLMNDGDCFKYWLKEYEGNEKIILIVCTGFGKKVISDVHNSTSIIAIYMYSSDYISDDKWIQGYWKVRSVVLDINEMVRQLLRDLIYMTHMNDSNNQSILHKPSIDVASTCEVQIKFDQNVIQSASELSILFVLIDLSTHLNQLAIAMLGTLNSLTDDSILIFENSSAIDFTKLPKKTTFLFVSSEFVATMINKPEQIKAVFILESDLNNIDHQERFATDVDLICQLADEIYRCYIKEASEYLILGDLSRAETKAKQAERIHNELQKVHENYFERNNTTTISMCTATTIVWLKSKLHNNIEVEKVENLFSTIISSFVMFASQDDCHEYLLRNSFDQVVFLIIDNEYKESIVVDFQHLVNVKQIYHYGESPYKNETTIRNCHDLCFQLTYDLITHYNKLGNDCSERQDAETAKNMFTKAHELCTIFAKI